MTDYKEISERLIAEITTFEQELFANSQHSHNPPYERAHANIIEHFAKSIIDVEFADLKVGLVNNITVLVKELQELDNR